MFRMIAQRLVSSLMSCLSWNQRSDNQNKPRGFQRQNLHPQGTFHSWSAKPPQNSCPPPHPSSERAGRGQTADLMRADVSSHFTVWITSNSLGWQGKWASLGYKSPNLDWLSLSPGPWADTSVPGTNSLRKESAGLEWHVGEAGWLRIARNGGRGGAATLKRRSGKVSDLVRIQTGARICLALIWHQYLSPHLCSLSVRAIPGPVSLWLWHCLFGLC